MFELPLIMGIISPDILTRFRKYAFLIAFIIGWIVMPTPDVFNMTLMSLPVYFLHEIGILGVRFFGRRIKSDDTEMTNV